MGRPAHTLRIAADDRIEAVDGSLDSFALARGALPLACAGPGVLLWTLFPDERVRQLYRHLVDGVRAGAPAAYDVFTDADGTRTWAGVSLSPLPAGGVQVHVAWLREEPVPAAPSGGGVPDVLLRVCSWCSRVETGAVWEEIGVAVVRLGLLGRAKPADISHGICPDCSAEQSRGI